MNRTNVREGPTQWMTTRYLVCSGCKWHEVIMLVSSRRSLYHHECNHPAHAEKSNNLKLKRFIGASPETPDWCPALLPNNA